MLTSINLATQLLESTANGGGTVWYRDQYTSGYCVALEGYEMRLSLTLCRVSTIQFYIENLVSPLADGVGVWVDDGFVYIDSVKHVDTLERAVSMGKANKQLAIYDIQNERVIDL